MASPTCLLAEFGTSAGGGGWIHDVSFSPSGDELAFVAHDASINVANGNVAGEADGTFAVSRVDSKDLPYRAVTWVTPSSLICAGHGYVPVLATYVLPQAASDARRIPRSPLTRLLFVRLFGCRFVDGALSYGASVDAPVKKAAKAMSAMDKFRTLDRKGTSSASSTDTSVQSTHQNAISDVCFWRRVVLFGRLACLRPGRRRLSPSPTPVCMWQIFIFKGDKSNCEEFVTAGVDGKLVHWKMSEVRAVDGVNVV